MSEFSDCYFLRTFERRDAKRLLTRVRRYGLVLSSSRSWVPFLVDGVLDAGAPAHDVVRHNEGVLLHYSYAEDHGLTLSFYEDTVESLRIEIQRRGPSEIDVPVVLRDANRLHLVAFGDARLEAALAPTRLPSVLDLAAVRDRVASVLDFDPPQWVGCADLSRCSRRELETRHPGALFVLASLRGRYDEAVQPAPNAFCPVPGLPAFMYLPVPTADVDAVAVERHFQHWATGADFDVEQQAGFWLYNAYRRALPSRYAYLADRIMNISLAFPDQKEKALRDAVRGVLAVVDRDFDWEPYFSRRAGEERL